MKLMWLHLMPDTELPDDFRDKNYGRIKSGSDD